MTTATATEPAGSSPSTMSNRAFHVVILAIALTGCTQINRATLAASTLGIACDAAQTYRLADDHWRLDKYNYHEGNVVMGRDPSASTVLAYFSAVAIVNTALWIVMPDRLKSVAPVAISAVQASTIVGNIAETGHVCGI